MGNPLRPRPRAVRRFLLAVTVVAGLLPALSAGCQLRIGPDVKLTPGVPGGVSSSRVTAYKRANALYDRAYDFAAAYKNADARKVFRMLTTRAQHGTSPQKIRRSIVKKYSGINGVAEFKVDRNSVRVDGKTGRAVVVFVRENGWSGRKMTVWRWQNGRWRLDRGY